MKEAFDYDKAMAELEKIEAAVKDPATPLGEMDKLLEHSASLIAGCRKYLRSQREKLESYEENL